MNNNISIYEIQEEREEPEEGGGRDDREEDINTRRDLVFERLNTEYGEEDEEYDYEVIAKELSKYTEISVALLATFTAIQFVMVYHINIQFSIIPLFLLEFRRLFIYTLQLKNSKEYHESDLIKGNSLKQIIHSIGNISFYSLVLIYFSTRAYYFLLTCLPLIISEIINFILKCRPFNQCQFFSKIVRNI